MIDYFVNTLPHFLGWFGGATLLAVAFLALYAAITPHAEFALIRAGNTAAAFQLVGTFIGFAIPVAVVIANSVSIPDMLLWASVAAIVQLLIFFIVTRFLFKSLSASICDNCGAAGLLIGGLGIGFGILQAACMIP